LPLHAEGREHATTWRAVALGRELARRHGLPVTLVDERFTSEVARADLAAAGRGARADRPLRDQAAAAIILQAFFDGDGG
jgi:putative Holliday junction resolvase